MSECALFALSYLTFEYFKGLNKMNRNLGSTSHLGQFPPELQNIIDQSDWYVSDCCIGSVVGEVLLVVFVYDVRLLFGLFCLRSYIVTQLQSAESDAMLMACGGEWCCCLCTGFFCIFCFHPMFNDALAKSNLEK